MTEYPAVVTIPALTRATTLSTTALFEAAQTTNNVGESVSVSVQQLASTILTSFFTGTTGLPLVGNGSALAPSFQVLGLVGGGIGTTALTVNRVLLGNGTSAIAVSGVATTGLPLIGNGTSAAPGFAVLGLSGGGTGTTTLTAFGVVYGNGTSTIGITAAGTTAWPLLGNGSAAAPSFGVLTVPGGGTGTTTLTQAGVIFGNGTSTVGITAAGATALPLTASGNTTGPTFSVLTVPGGGTGTTTLTANRVLIGAGTTTLALSNVATAGLPLVGNGTSAAPGFAVLGVPGGGLGTGTTTPFAVLIGGATATAQVQSLATTGASGLVLTSQGSSIAPLFTTAPLFAGTITPQGRLTLASGVPVMGASQAAIATAYYTPYVGNLIPLSDGASNFSVVTFSELSQPANSSTLSPAAVAASSVYDVFAWQQNATTVAATRGFAWQNMTTRGSTAALVRVGGVWLNTNAITNGPGAQRGTYLGTLASDGSSVFNYVFGAVASGCVAANFAVWNCYNRVLVKTFLGDSTDTWAASTTGAGSGGTWRAANNSTTARISAVRGLDEDGVDMTYAGAAFVNGGAVNLAIGVGLNTTGAFSGSTNVTLSTAATYLDGRFSGFMGLGYNFLQAIELSAGTNTATFAGDAGVAYIQTGIHGTLVQ